MAIPAFQQRSPAGHPDIPYLPSCLQLEARPGGAEGWNAWGPVIDDVHQNWHGIPSSWDVTQAYADLESWGFCTTEEGAVNVPFVSVENEVEEIPETTDNSGVPGIWVERLAPEESTQENPVVTNNIPEIYVNKTQEQPTTSTQEVPPIYQQKTSGDSVSAEGSAWVAGGILLTAGVIVYQRWILPNLAAARMEAESHSQIRTVPADMDAYTPVAEPVVSARPSAIAPPSVWAHAGSPENKAFHGENQGEKWGENSGENSEKSGERKTFHRENSGEIIEAFRRQLIKAESLTTPGFSPTFHGENQGENRLIDVSVNNETARDMFFQLREKGVVANTTLGQEIFGISGGKRWDEVKEVLTTWNTEWEMINGQSVSKNAR